MPQPIKYEQILQELLASKAVQPWDLIPAPASTPAPQPPPQTDPLALAMKRQQIQGAFAPMEQVANPKGEHGNSLIRMLMGLLK